MSINKRIKKAKKFMPKWLRDQISNTSAIPIMCGNSRTAHPYGEKFIIEDRDKSIEVSDNE